MRKLIILIICLLPIFTACYQGEAIEPIEEQPIVEEIEEETIDIEELKKSCVILYVKKYADNGTYSTHGSGVLIDYDKILTVYHAVDGFTEFVINYNDNNKDYYCTLDSVEPETDSAVLKPPRTDIKPVSIGDSDKLKTGDKIYIIGCPNGEKNVVTVGKFVAPYADGTMLASIETHPGNSGGGVFNTKGELIGIVHGAVEKFNETYFIPINNITIK